MTITTSTQIPEIKQLFDPLLLLYGKVEYYNYNRKKLVEYAKRKIREQDIGKLLQFKALHDEFMEVYGRKIVEEKEFEESQKNSSKRPGFSHASATLKFKRFQT